MSEEQSREEFEAAYLAEVDRRTGKASPDVFAQRDGEYIIGLVQAAWWGWQASRSELVVELPDARSLSASDDPWAVLDWCKDAIEAAGITVKP